MAIVGEYIEGS